jgi:hypothetical protein
MTVLDFVAVVFAAGAIIEVWHKGSIFETARAYVQAWQDVAPPESVKGRLWELLMCPFCKSYHVPLYLFALLLASDHIGGIMPALGRAVIYSLAATRIGNIIDGLLPARMRYDPPLTFGENFHGQADNSGPN